MAIEGRKAKGETKMGSGTSVSRWMKRAEQARRVAETLSARDRDLLRDYARECEFRARWLRRSDEVRAA